MNLGWLFYKKLYSDVAGNKVKQNYIKKLVQTPVHSFEDGVSHTHGFELRVLYPGLLIGTGYMHGLPNDENDIKTGFFLDHTYGTPVVPGSSVKGVLRSFFEGEHLDEKKELICQILGKSVDLGVLVDEIFEGKERSIYKRDIFLDALVQGNLAIDYITPHEEFKDPNPIRILKIAPNSTVEFRFILRDGIISADEKEKLFFELLQLGDVGAKVRVGYGNLQPLHSLEYFRQKRQEAKEERRKKLLEQKKKEQLANMPLEERLFLEHKESNTLTDLINKMRGNKIEADYKKLAKLIKSELQKNTKTWEKAKKKALDRKKFIESLLKNV